MLTTIGRDTLHAKQLLENGALVAIPTETVYGLAANALDEKAVLKIFEAKNRPHFNPLIVHVPSWEAAQLYIQNAPAIAHELAKHFCPGPLTFLLDKKEMIPDLVTSGSDLVAIRIPNHPLSLELLNSLNFPLAAPSANQFGYISPTNAQHVFDSLSGKIEYILDGGHTSIGIESTIIGFGEEGNVIIYRVGGISIEEIERVIKQKVSLQTKHIAESPNSPGQLKSHYAPHTDLLIGNIQQLHTQFASKNLGLISLSNPYQELNFNHRFLLSPDGNLNEAAQNLFAYLRQIDQYDLDLILVELMPETGLGNAINDRLQRAQVIYK